MVIYPISEEEDNRLFVNFYHLKWSRNQLIVTTHHEILASKKTLRFELFRTWLNELHHLVRDRCMCVCELVWLVEAIKAEADDSGGVVYSSGLASHIRTPEPM